MGLCSDGALTCQYTLLVSTETAGQMQVPVLCTPGAAKVSDIQFTVDDGQDLTLVRATPAPVYQPGLTLEGGAAGVATLVFAYESYASSQRVMGTLSFVVDGDAERHSLEFAVDIPVGAFIVAMPCAPADFAAICGALPVHVATRIESTNAFPVVASTLMANLRVTLVDASDSAVSLYGCSVRQEHVALLVKAIGVNEFSVDMKCTDQALASTLLREAENLFE
eukprot:c5004_g1_i1.p1 GENE.c5004_g1_i1~~c5004_g1_i1.p1  ORF type:complete len:223 (+),score=49.21 c5004_g1_i1:3-671(+)